MRCTKNHTLQKLTPKKAAKKLWFEEVELGGDTSSLPIDSSASEPLMDRHDVFSLLASQPKPTTRPLITNFGLFTQSKVNKDFVDVPQANSRIPKS